MSGFRGVQKKEGYKRQLLGLLDPSLILLAFRLNSKCR